MARTHKPNSRLAELAGDVPKLATSDDLMSAVPTNTGQEIPRNRSARKPGHINLKAVAEVLSEEGMDLGLNLVRILQAGTLEPEVAARIQLELLQYVQPKLKAVEMRVSGELELTNEQLDDRIRALMSKTE